MTLASGIAAALLTPIEIVAVYTTAIDGWGDLASNGPQISLFVTITWLVPCCTVAVLLLGSHPKPPANTEPRLSRIERQGFGRMIDDNPTGPDDR